MQNHPGRYSSSWLERYGCIVLDGRRASVRKPTSVALRCVAGFRPKFPFELRHSVLGRCCARSGQ